MGLEGGNCADRTRLFLIRLTSANDAVCPAHDATNSVTSTLFTVPAGVPAGTVTWPATVLPLPNTTKFCETLPIAVWSEALELTRNGAVSHVSDDSAHVKAGAMPIKVSSVSCAGAAATVSSRIAELSKPAFVSAGTRNWTRDTLRIGDKTAHAKKQCKKVVVGRSGKTMMNLLERAREGSDPSVKAPGATLSVRAQTAISAPRGAVVRGVRRSHFHGVAVSENKFGIGSRGNDAVIRARDGHHALRSNWRREHQRAAGAEGMNPGSLSAPQPSDQGRRICARQWGAAAPVAWRGKTNLLRGSARHTEKVLNFAVRTSAGD